MRLRAPDPTGLRFDPHTGAILRTDPFEDKNFRKKFGNDGPEPDVPDGASFRDVQRG